MQASTYDKRNPHRDQYPSTVNCIVLNMQANSELLKKAEEAAAKARELVEQSRRLREAARKNTYFTLKAPSREAQSQKKKS